MDPEQRAAFAKRVLLKRTELYPKLKKLAFCKLAGITRTTLRSVEDPGNQQQPSVATITALARAFRMTPAELRDDRRIAPDHPLLADLTEEDLGVAKLFHHAGLTVKQRTVGVLQERQTPSTTLKALTADATTLVQRILTLDADQRYVVAAFVTLLERTRGIDDTILTFAARVQRLSESDRQDILDAVQHLEHAATKADSRKPPSRPKLLKPRSTR